MSSTPRATILYLEDDVDFREALKVVVEDAGYRVVVAGSAEDGLRLFREDPPDIVLVDLMMEEIDAGMNFVKEIHALGRKPPIFLISSMGDALLGSRDWRELGLSGVLQKPVRSAVLLELLERHLPHPA